MSKVISFVNAKGGVGKTTSSVNVAASLAERGFKVLLLDMDPQGNATSYMAIQPQEIEQDMFNLLLERATFEQVVKTKYGLDIVPFNTSILDNIEAGLVMKQSSELSLVMAIEDHIEKYDYVIIDCPPALGLLTTNALLASDFYIVPVEPKPFSVNGVAKLDDFVKRIKRVNKGLQFAGYLVNEYNPEKSNSTFHIIVDHIKALGQPYFKSYIREDKVLYDLILVQGGHIYTPEGREKLGIKSTAKVRCVEDFNNLSEEILKL